MSPLSDLSDEILARRSAQGDEQAFDKLVRRYEQPISALIRYQIGDPDHAEDIFQETLLAAWIGLRRLRDPNKERAWLLQIARNRCRDFYRSSQWRDLPTEKQELEGLVNRFGRALTPQRAAASDVVEALEEVPAAERDAAKRFYLQGLTIAEIAARSRCPEGTIKRRLHCARNHVRQIFGVPRKTKEE